MIKTTGRYGTREELCFFVNRWYYGSEMKQAEIARVCRVSEGTVANIIKKDEGYDAYMASIAADLQ